MALPCPRRPAARAESLSAIGGFVGLCLTFVVVADARFPEWFDPEYAVRKELLADRVAEAPGRPILAVIGSSRAGTGIAVESLPPLYDADGRRVLAFNYSHQGAGPRLNLIQLHRLIRDGQPPKWIVFEVLPAHLDCEATQAAVASAADVPVLLTYVHARKFLGHFVRLRLNAPYRYRTAFLRDTAPAFATGTGAAEIDFIGGLGDDCIFRRLGPQSEERKARQFELIRSLYAEPMRSLRIDPALAAATGEALRLCQERGIQTVVLVAPEASEFRSWYGPGVDEMVRTFMDGLRAEFGVPVIDARTWSPDEDFFDPHHLSPDGARRFTERLNREVLVPLVRGELSECRPVPVRAGLARGPQDEH